MTDQTPELRTFRLPGLSLQAPADWEPIDAPGVDLMIASPDHPDDADARPRLTVVTKPSTASIQQLSSQVISAATSGATPSYVVACDIWDIGDPDHWGRQIERTHRAGSVQVDVITYLAAVGDRAIELTFSCPVAIRSAGADLASAIAGSLELSRKVDQ